ncbi:MAG: hypothetical protein GXP30_10860, partial [Verrucomicrobia bacterium]|nr:hypothetical protein [Verrucomicrobiota bacterium]
MITVLIIVAMLTMLMLAYISSTVIESRASVAYADTQRAKMVAQGGLAHAIAVLRANIPEPAQISDSAETAPGENWAINPGRLTVLDDQGNQTHFPLHTGAADISPDQTEDPDVNSVDLNEPVPGKTIPSITYTLDSSGEADIDQDPPLMRVKWVNILHDPSEPASKENPLVARHAFWIDDESGKINFNTALGKPARDNDPDGFHKQYKLGMMPPLFSQVSGARGHSAKNKKRQWALGKLRSVNLDVLFSRKVDLDKGQLIAHTLYRGFSRYPEAILDYVKLPKHKKMDWWHRNRYNLTFYSRSPEFNTFGRPRLMTTNIPLSLEGGPNYQLPFVYRGADAPDSLNDLKGILHMNALLGSLGIGQKVYDKGKGWASSANIVNRAQLEMMMRYFRRQFPGYEGSFVDKYGEVECAQIALNMMTMARVATAPTRSRFSEYSYDLGEISTSAIYLPHSLERARHTPERYYWRFEPGADGQMGRFLTEDESSTDETVQMLAQTPGPHITEIRLVFRSFPAKSLPPALSPNEAYRANGINRYGPANKLANKRWLGFRFEVEFYMHGVGPKVLLRHSPFRVDYFELDLTSDDGDRFNQELGPDEAENAEGRADRSWVYNKRRTDVRRNANGKQSTSRPIDRRSLGSLLVGSSYVSPYDASLKPSKQRNRRLIKGPWRFVGREQRWLGNPEDPNPSANDLPREFNADSISHIKVRFRGGEAFGGRPRLMIPLGERKEDTLQGTAEIDFRSSDMVSLSWQIADPRLGGHKEQWWYESPGDNSAGTPGARNINKDFEALSEPEEHSTKKSKFRYIQRAHPTFKIAGFKVNRSDEYSSRSRISSKGFWSMLHTGIQNRIPWRTLRLSPSAANDPAGPPDWLLMDLLGGTYPLQHDQWRNDSTLPDEFSTVSYMHSTAGAINLNSKVYPEDSPYFQAPERVKPLQAVFKNLRSDGEIARLLDGIRSYQANNYFKYVGELSKVNGYNRLDSDATEFQNEELLRNMIACLTTKSNTFGVWGVGQVVKKIPSNVKWEQFEDGDIVQGEKRFFAIVERYIWLGKDGVPGNAHVNSQGVWD